jgi:hypothetical protein
MHQTNQAIEETLATAPPTKRGAVSMAPLARGVTVARLTLEYLPTNAVQPCSIARHRGAERAELVGECSSGSSETAKVICCPPPAPSGQRGVAPSEYPGPSEHSFEPYVPARVDDPQRHADTRCAARRGAGCLCSGLRWWAVFLGRGRARSRGPVFADVYGQARHRPEIIRGAA